MNRAALEKWMERGILGLVLAILLFTPLAFGGRPQLPAGFFLDFLLVDTFQVAEWLIIAVILLWGARLWLNPRPKLLWPPICWAVIAFTLYAIARYATADIEYVARQELMRILVYAFLFFAIINNLHRQEHVQVITLALVFLAMSISFYAVYQFLADSTRVWHVFTQYDHRASGTYICPNHLGGFLEMLLPLALAFSIASRLKPVSKIFLAYATFAMLAGIAATVSRGAWLATAFSLLVFFIVLLFHRSFRLPALLFLVLIVGATVVFMPRNYSFQARYKKLVVEGKLDDDLRFFMWEPALKVWQDNLWWGAGPAHFDYRFRQHRPEMVQLQPDRVHNDFLNALADWGLTGAALIASALVLLAIGIVKTWNAVRNTAPDLSGKQTSNKFAFLLGGTIGLIAILVHSVVDFNMHIPANAMLAVTLMALLSSHLRFATESYWFAMGRWSRIAATVVLIAGAVYLGLQTTRRARENYWLALFYNHLPDAYSQAQVDVLKKAFAIDPKNFDTAYNIGEAYCRQSQEGGEDYKELAAKAMEWFERAMKLNPWDGYNYLRYGWCLDWTGRQSESQPYFSKAEQLDPNGYYTMFYIGKHFVELGDFAAARPWLERSLRLDYHNNIVAQNWLPIVNRKLMENATNEINAKLSISVQEVLKNVEPVGGKNQTNPE
jgi:O-antigen ligase/Tfp pilus assembly protein PilF